MLSTARTELGARAVLDGRRTGAGAVLPFLGPAFVACVAYVDPGNFATNIAAGAQSGYTLLWVIVLANLMAMLLQGLSAKLGVATGRNLPELCREHFPRPLVYGMWVVAEVGAMATDVAELLGAAIGFNLLFHLPLLPAALLAGACTLGLLQLQRFGFRPLEALVTVVVLAIAVCYAAELVLAPPNWPAAAYHAVVPSLGGGGGVLLAAGILGATVMPHVLYLHSGLTQRRVTARGAAEARRILRFQNKDLIMAMGLAGLVNMAMLIMAASVFHRAGQSGVASLPEAFRTLTPLAGRASSTLFGVALLASGLSSSVVGTLAGQVIMQGFVKFALPVWLRRVVTMAPAFAIIAAGVDATQALVFSQVVLSLVLPVPVVSLIVLTSRRQVMGGLVNGRHVVFAGATAAAAIVTLNALLIYASV